MAPIEFNVGDYCSRMIQKVGDDTKGDDEDDGASVNLEMRSWDCNFEDELDMGECTGEGANARRLDFDDETSESDLYEIDEDVIDFPSSDDESTRFLSDDGTGEEVFPYQ